jgi:hypothetical protein
VISLFSSSPKKENSIELAEEADRARIQATIDRALQMPEAQITLRNEVQQFSVHEEVSENGTAPALQMPEETIAPWDVLKQFIVREEVAESAA